MRRRHNRLVLGLALGGWVASADGANAQAPAVILDAVRPAAAPAPAAVNHQAYQPAALLGEVRPAAMLESPRPVVYRAQAEAPMPRAMPMPTAPAPIRPVPMGQAPAPTPVPGSNLLPFPKGATVMAPAGPTISSEAILFSGDYDGSGCLLEQGCCQVPAARYWIGAEYLMWYVDQSPVPPLVTTGPMMAALPGTLNTPGVMPILGGSSGGMLPNQMNGLRLSGGFWFSDANLWGLDASGFFLGQGDRNQTVTSFQYPLMGRPFMDSFLRVPNTEIVAAPGLSTGGVNVAAETDLYGADINLRRNLWNGCFCRLDLLGGFRFLGLNDELRISETVFGDVNSASPVAADTLVATVFDRFRTENRFYGGQIGLASEVRRGRWFADGRVKVAIGSTTQTVEINGSTAMVSRASGMTTTLPGGLLAVGTNSGRFSRTDFSVVPEVGLNLGAYVTERCKVFVGYNFLFWTNVVRAPDQIDMMVDQRQVPFSPFFGQGAPPAINRPIVPFKDSDFWAQGLTVGLEVNW